MRGLWATIVKSLVFVVVTVLATVVLAATIRSSGPGGGRHYDALFSDVTSLNVGDDVRMAGVRIGRVADVEVDQRRLARVRMELDPGVRVQTGATVAVRFRTLVGQRYLALTQPEDLDAPPMADGAVFSLDQTQPALDLTVLFNGFQPLFRLLSPEDVNALSGQIIQVFQGEGTTVESLLSHTARLTQTVADRDQVIGSVIDNLNRVLDVVNTRRGDLDGLITTLQRLVSGLAEDREAIGSSIEGIGLLTTDVADLVEGTRPGLRRSIDGLGGLAGNLADDEDLVGDFLSRLPTKLDRIGRLASYGSWLNFYLCSVDGSIVPPEGYTGDVGALPVAARCSG